MTPRLATICPDAKVEVIEDSRLFVTEDQAAAVAVAIRTFAAERVHRRAEITALRRSRRTRMRVVRFGICWLGRRG